MHDGLNEPRHGIRTIQVSSGKGYRLGDPFRDRRSFPLMRPSSTDPISHDPPPVSPGRDDLFDAEQLGRFFGLGTDKPNSARAAINMRIRRKHPMPPSIVVPGLSGRRWLHSSVKAWLKTYERSDATATVEINVPETAPAPTVVVPRRRGRPTKAEAMAGRGATPCASESAPRIKTQ